MRSFIEFSILPAVRKELAGKPYEEVIGGESRPSAESWEIRTTWPRYSYPALGRLVFGEIPETVLGITQEGVVDKEFIARLLEDGIKVAPLGHLYALTITWAINRRCPYDGKRLRAITTRYDPLDPPSWVTNWNDSGDGDNVYRLAIAEETTIKKGFFAKPYVGLRVNFTYGTETMVPGDVLLVVRQ